MKWIKSILLGAMVLWLSGCYVCETIETRIQLGENGKQARVTIIYRNISSGEAKEKDVQHDFDQLLKDWQGDDYLLDRAQEGLIVRNREVFIDHGVLTARVTGIMRDISDQYSFWVSHGERIMIYETDDDYKLVETNGKILKTEKNTLIIWPEEAKELYWKQQISELPGSFAKNKKLFIEWFKKYQAEKGGQG